MHSTMCKLPCQTNFPSVWLVQRVSSKCSCNSGDRVTGFYPVGRGFESCQERAHAINQQEEYMRSIIAAIVLALGLFVAGSATASAAPTTQFGGWVYNAPLQKADGTTDVYQINAVATGSKSGKTMVTSSITCRYLQDPDPNSGAGTWQDWVVVGEFTEAPTTPIATEQQAKQYCIDNAFKAV